MQKQVHQYSSVYSANEIKSKRKLALKSNHSKSVDHVNRVMFSDVKMTSDFYFLFFLERNTINDTGFALIKL